jgi:hypothetical protein
MMVLLPLPVGIDHPVLNVKRPDARGNVRPSNTAQFKGSY